MDTYGLTMKKPLKLLAVLLTAGVVLAAVAAAGVGGTLAAPDDIVVDLKNESGVPADMTLAAGETQRLSVSYLYQAYGSNPDVATVEYTEGSSFNNVRILGKTAGTVAISFGTKRGLLVQSNYLVTDSRNVSKYTIKDNGEVYFAVPSAPGAPGSTKPSPVTVREGNAGTISWSSMNEKVARVGTNGAITAVGKGATVIVGNFTDKWGVKRVLLVMVGVGVYLSGDNNLGKLLEFIEQGEALLAERDEDGESPYSNNSRKVLSGAVEMGLSVFNPDSAAIEHLQTIMDFFDNALNNMEPRMKEGFKIKSMWISPPDTLGYVPTVNAGGTMQFEVFFEGEGTIPKEAVWQVSNNKSSSTRINTNGLLTVASDETADTLAIRATNAADSHATRQVTIRVSHP